ncbi:U3 snoRNP protein [Verticillium alfalfae VaMs.102]|uniref:U3 snoRNP protein n=1 Tax=Verticillium alfalfae (strain VaMs.102 / ATCC MYA-4576 / FGSC 10136) TaxID=526221 RepID=C9SFJ4_VERA1|nr:U3 snoRNP protein [Verticillium alfalfae VaMs.102]EEY17327.1 U3 snoRNP protein [Verticillium alfalfae VaMs.102]
MAAAELFQLRKVVDQDQDGGCCRESSILLGEEEIRNIVQRRSDFEHRALAPGVQPTDFTNYVAWEISLDALRVKRCERLKIRHVASQHATQARVLAIYERAVTKRPASKELWLDYLTYTERIRATKRWRRTMTRALRLMPRDAELWVLAGRRAAKNGDMGTARGYFMRGCRFCTVDGGLWIEYARCEMEWLAKMERNRKDSKKGGRVGPLAGEQVAEGDAIMFNVGEDDLNDEDEGTAIMPEPEAEEPVFDEKPPVRWSATQPWMVRYQWLFSTLQGNNRSSTTQPPSFSSTCSPSSPRCRRNPCSSNMCWQSCKRTTRQRLQHGAATRAFRWWASILTRPTFPAVFEKPCPDSRSVWKQHQSLPC